MTEKSMLFQELIEKGSRFDPWRAYQVTGVIGRIVGIRRVPTDPGHLTPAT